MQLEMQIHGYFKKAISDKNNQLFQMFLGIKPKTIKFWLWKGTMHFCTLSIEVQKAKNTPITSKITFIGKFDLRDSILGIEIYQAPIWNADTWYISPGS